jgi:hypothetical protein
MKISIILMIILVTSCLNLTQTYRFYDDDKIEKAYEDKIRNELDSFDGKRVLYIWFKKLNNNDHFNLRLKHRFLTDRY